MPSPPARPLAQPIHLLQCLRLAMAFPAVGGGPTNPGSLFIAHRCIPALHAGFGQELELLGITPLLESEHEARRSSALHDTDWRGFNWRDDPGYKDEEWESADEEEE
jgi:hypothetical protein